jgi:hypothetical protein
MSIKQEIDDLIHRIADLPDEAQDELVRTIIGMRGEDLGFYDGEGDGRTAFARSGDEAS